MTSPDRRAAARDAGNASPAASTASSAATTSWRGGPLTSEAGGAGETGDSEDVDADESDSDEDSRLESAEAAGEAGSTPETADSPDTRASAASGNGTAPLCRVARPPSGSATASPTPTGVRSWDSVRVDSNTSRNLWANVGTAGGVSNGPAGEEGTDGSTTPQPSPVRGRSPDARADAAPGSGTASLNGMARPPSGSAPASPTSTGVWSKESAELGPAGKSAGRGSTRTGSRGERSPGARADAASSSGNASLNEMARPPSGSAPASPTSTGAWSIGGGAPTRPPAATAT